MLAIFNALIFGSLLFSLLFQTGYVQHTDVGLFTYPFMTLFHERMGSMGVFWNDLSGAGFPSLYIHGYVFNPLLWILLAVMNPISALHWSMFVHAWLASCLLGI
ncbi:hypothetical protein EXS65_05065, partial [Candidatus Peribacteria bacterium]|nr:hypothetical protein [Candidatus Peribacteria bacterium]